MNRSEVASGESSDSSDSSSSSDSPDTAPGLAPAPVPDPSVSRKRKRRRSLSSKRKAKRHRRRTDDAIAKLAEQVSHIKDFIGSVAFQPAYNNNIQEYNHDCQSDVSADVSGELYVDEVERGEPSAEAPPEVAMSEGLQGSSENFELSLNTVLKEPSIPKSLPAHVEFLKSIQHFETEDWDNVRYAEVQKQYCSSPGFNYLETNDELKPYDKTNALALIERGFASITQAIIKHNEAAQAGFKTLIDWAGATSDLSPNTLKVKINDVFVKGSFHKTSSDILQLACGHRAEIIQQRRDTLLRAIKDSYVKSSLRKIPPSCESLFKKEIFSSGIEKAGGAAKVFWPPRAATSNKTAAQARSNQQVQASPSYANYRQKDYAQAVSNYPQLPINSVRMPRYAGHNYAMQGRDNPRPPQRYTQGTRPLGPRSHQDYDAQPGPSRGRGRGQSFPRMQSKRRL